LDLYLDLSQVQGDGQATRQALQEAIEALNRRTGGTA
jgi:hypothetical protein